MRVNFNLFGVQDKKSALSACGIPMFLLFSLSILNIDYAKLMIENKFGICFSLAALLFSQAAANIILSQNENQSHQALAKFITPIAFLVIPASFLVLLAPDFIQ